MDKLLDNIYKKFFLRDVISIFMCGFLFLLAMLMINGEQIEQIKDIISNPIVEKILKNKDNELSLFSYGLLIGVSYALGLIINWFRDYAQFRWCYNCSCNKTKQKSQYSENVEDYQYKVDRFYKNPPEITDDFERKIVMFQVTGNFALTMMLCLIGLLFWNLSLDKLTVIASVVGCVIALICFSIFKFMEHITYLGKKTN